LEGGKKEDRFLEGGKKEDRFLEGGKKEERGSREGDARASREDRFAAKEPPSKEPSKVTYIVLYGIYVPMEHIRQHGPTRKPARSYENCDRHECISGTRVY